MNYTCPNCNIELDIKKVPDIDGKGNVFYRIMYLCGICSYGWYVDSENKD